SSSGDFAWRLAGDRVNIVHRLTPATISDSRLVQGLGELVEARVLSGQGGFEAAAVAVVSSVAADPAAAWFAFYANSLAELSDGRSAFAPIHARALDLLAGDEVLEVGCCFGFFAVRCAQSGHRVHACDLTAGAVSLLDQVAPRLGVEVQAVCGDARVLPFGDGAVDTVTLIHLLEHLDADDVEATLTEAFRVARRRVVVAVPFEDEPTEHYGHLQRLSEDDLHRWAALVPQARSEIFTDHGGWLILDR
ncbi:MAG: mycofactocin oligosaccharide methyltransferase MftM, partial [Gordonia sp. (in: high G+C Gram-positive bacteria)]|uniref:mycofactocin oligosaccharide methyltransferase MftM n=1 Tax=Gordonia sp. (in: high G+C Gram-positive bacteria) TaxID=84139 RepID=UPI003BB76029